MDILGFIDSHMAQLVSLAVAIFFVTVAKVFIPSIKGAQKKERGPHFRWAAFFCYAIGGFALAAAMVPFIGWLVGLGARTGMAAFIGNVTAIAGLAIGWHAIAMIVSVIRDLADKVPDHQARTGALWIPTFLPIGAASVWQLVQNPQGLGQGLSAAVMAGITLFYAFMIAGRADEASSHRTKWNWFVFIVFLLAGIVIIPLMAYVDTALIAQLPSELVWIPRVFLGLAGIVAAAGLVRDLWGDGIPQTWARRGAVFAPAALFVFGGIAITWITGATQDGASMMNGVF